MIYSKELPSDIKGKKKSLIMQYTEPYTRLTSYKRLRWSAAYKNDTDS